MNKPHIRAMAADYRNCVELMVLDHGADGSLRAVGKYVTMEEVTEDYLHHEPTLRISNHHAQLLMDDLWQAKDFIFRAIVHGMFGLGE